MSIRLLMSVLVAGVHYGVDGATLSLSFELESDLVAQGKAVWVNPPFVRTDMVAHADEHAAMGVQSIDAIRAQSSVAFLAGQEDETYAAVSCTITADTTNFVIGAQSALMTMAGAVTAQLRRDFSPPLNFGKAQAIGISVYLPDATKITAIEVDIYQDAALSVQWVKSKTTGLVNGWNHIRFSSAVSTATLWGTCYRLRVMVTTNGATTCSVGHVWAECRPKASIMIINDGPYANWIKNIYPWFKDRKLPVVLAPDVAILGSGSGITLRATEQQILSVAADGNGNEVSFHGYDGAATSAMTAAELKADTRKAQAWLIERGFVYGSLWRAAYVQNLATNYAACDSILVAQATATGTATPDVWPAITMNNIGRMSVHGRTPATIDTQFSNLEKFRNLMLFYYHNVDEGGGTNATPEEDAYFKSKISDGVNSGWLEVVTFETLFKRLGGAIENHGGRVVASLKSIAGTTQKFVVA